VGCYDLGWVCCIVFIVCVVFVGLFDCCDGDVVSIGDEFCVVWSMCVWLFIVFVVVGVFVVGFGCVGLLVICLLFLVVFDVVCVGVFL